MAVNRYGRVGGSGGIQRKIRPLVQRQGLRFEPAIPAAKFGSDNTEGYIGLLPSRLCLPGANTRAENSWVSFRAPRGGKAWLMIPEGFEEVVKGLDKPQPLLICGVAQGKDFVRWELSHPKFPHIPIGHVDIKKGTSIPYNPRYILAKEAKYAERLRAAALRGDLVFEVERMAVPKAWQKDRAGYWLVPGSEVEGGNPANMCSLNGRFSPKGKKIAVETFGDRECVPKGFKKIIFELDKAKREGKAVELLISQGESLNNYFLAHPEMPGIILGSVTTFGVEAGETSPFRVDAQTSFNRDVLRGKLSFCRAAEKKEEPEKTIAEPKPKPAPAPVAGVDWKLEEGGYFWEVPREDITGEVPGTVKYGSLPKRFSPDGSKVDVMVFKLYSNNYLELAPIGFRELLEQIWGDRENAFEAQVVYVDDGKYYHVSHPSMPNVMAGYITAERGNYQIGDTIRVRISETETWDDLTTYGPLANFEFEVV